MSDQGVKLNVFYANMSRYESYETALTGEQIKSMANASMNNHLFQDKFGDGPDIGIGDGQAVNIRESIKHFYTLLPATFGGKAHE